MTTQISDVVKFTCLCPSPQCISCKSCLCKVVLIVDLSPVVDGDELEQVLAFPLAGNEDHQGARAGAVGPQAWHEGLQHLELGWSGQHCQDLSENIKH